MDEEMLDPTRIYLIRCNIAVMGTKIMRLMCVVILCSVSLLGTAQNAKGVLKGVATEEIGGATAGDVHVQVRADEQVFNTITDSLGRYSISDIPVGLYEVVFSSMIYESVVFTEVWIRSGKQTVVSAPMKRRVNQLGEAEVSAEGSAHRAAAVYMAPVGVRSFTVEQSLRYAATFSDPARLVTTYPGVVPVNDQANHFSVRGNSPNASKWMIEGLEIVNPSHTGNAGTPSDRPTLSGGGVNAFSTQMLRRSSFLNGVYRTKYSNATGSLMDMYFRKGNNERTEWTLGAGLIGIDVANEGPISKKNGSSYLINYRYSTLGVLSAMGVDLGDEAIKFQDIAANVDLPLSKRSHLQLFGMGGTSDNVFEGPRDTALWEFDKDSLDIDYRSKLAVGGLVYTYRVNDRMDIRLGSAYSGVEQSRTQNSINANDGSTINTYTNQLDNYKWSSRFGLSVRHSASWTAEYAVAGTHHSIQNREPFNYSDYRAWLIRPYTDHTVRLGERYRLSLGLAYSHWQLSADEVLEPRVRFVHELSERSQWSLSAGRVAQIPALQVYPSWFVVGSTPALYAPMEVSTGLDIAYRTRLNKGFTLVVQAYAQRIENQGVSSLNLSIPMWPPFHFSNAWDQLITTPVLFNGVTENVGLECSLDKRFQKGTFFTMNAAFNRSAFGPESATIGLGETTRWSRPWSGNISFGKEFLRSKDGLDRVLGISGRLIASSGNRFDRIDPDTQAATYLFDGTYSAFHRLDLRIYWKKYRDAKTGVWALDIQNAMNAKNGVYDRYDQRADQIITETQFGIIPNLSYRIEF